MNKLLKKEDLEATEYVVMALSDSIFDFACNLYPKTAKSLKYRALDRRNYYLRHMQLQEQEYAVDRDRKTGLKIKVNKPATLEDEMVFEEKI